MSQKKLIIYLGLILFVCAQWIVLKFSGITFHAPWNAVAPGLAIFGAAFLLSWAAELAQFEIPEALAISFLAFIAVLPEYAVDAYFAWEAAKDPQYIHYATANMTGANRLLIGMGWATVIFAYYFRSKKTKVVLPKTSRIDLMALSLATLYCFIIPIKGTLTYWDSIVLLSIFALYIFKQSQTHHAEPEVEGPVAVLAKLPRGRRIFVTLLLFFISGFTIFIAAEPFAEGLLESGRRFGVEEFILVQWLAPLASESPEFIVAIIFALNNKPTASLSTLVSSKVNQWTLLVGMLPLIYSFSAGRILPMELDARQSEEILLTVAQSFFAIAVIANLSISLWEALILFGLFATQLFFTSGAVRHVYAYVYIGLAFLLLLTQKENRRGLYAVMRETLKSSS